MKPPPFDYAAPSSVTEAVDLLAATEDAKLLAGGQSLMPLLALRLARPTLLVDLQDVEALSSIETSVRSVRFGAMVRQHQLVGSTSHPLIGSAARWIAHAAIRSRGTIGGSLAHADSAAELPVVATAVGATMEAVGRGRSRSIGADQFFHGLLQTALAEDEVLTAIDFPLPRRWGFAELARRHGDFALVLVAVAEMPSEDDRTHHWQIAVGGIEGTPRRCLNAEQEATVAGVHTAAQIEAVARLASTEIEAVDHLHASATYQRAMTAELVSRALTQAVEPTTISEPSQRETAP